MSANLTMEPEEESNTLDERNDLIEIESSLNRTENAPVELVFAATIAPSDRRHDTSHEEIAREGNDNNNDTPIVAIATKREWTEHFRNGKVQTCLGFFVLVLIGLVTAFIMTSRDRDDRSNNNNEGTILKDPTDLEELSTSIPPSTFHHPTSSPSASPTFLDWKQVGSDLDGPSSGQRDFFGTSVSLSRNGTRVAIGGEGNDGTVKVYEDNGQGDWTDLGIGMFGDAKYDYFGCSVSLSSDGDRVAIGARANKNDAGLVRTYRLASNFVQVFPWQRFGQDLEGEAGYRSWSDFGDFFGHSVSFSGDATRVAIGAPYGGENDSGYVKIFDFAKGNNTWIQNGMDIRGDAANESFGCSVSLSRDGRRVAVKADGETEQYVRVYELTQSSSWKQIGQDINRDTRDLTIWGQSIELSSDGRRVAVCGNSFNFTNEYREGTVEGYTRIFDYISGSWVQVGSDIVSQVSDLQRSRYPFKSVSLSEDGTRVAIANTVFDDYKGYVRVFEQREASWIQIGSAIYGNETMSRFGFSISLSADGSRVAIGEQYGSRYRGRVQVFELTG